MDETTGCGEETPAQGGMPAAGQGAAEIEQEGGREGESVEKPAGVQRGATSGRPAAPEPCDYEAARAAKLAYRASLSDEDVARMRKHEKPAGYSFGCKVAEGVEGASASGDEEERRGSAEQAERDMRIQQAARVDDWQARLDAMSSEERVQATLDCLGRRPSFARVLRAVLDYCRQERDSDEVEAYIETLPDFAANRQSARRYVFFLMRTGALAEVGYDAQGNPVDERAVQAVQDEPGLAPVGEVEAWLRHGASPEEADGTAVERPVDECGECAGATPSQVRMVADATGAEMAACAEGGACDSDPRGLAGEGPSACEVTVLAAEPDLADPAVAWRLTTTPEGLRALAATDAHVRLRDLLAGQVQDRYEAYLDVLTFCEEPRTLAQISEFLIGNPGLEIDDRGVVNMQPNAYIGKLDKAGALVWTGKGWQTTKEALEVLEEC